MDPKGKTIHPCGAEDQACAFFDGGKEDGNLCPVRIANVFVFIILVIIRRNLMRIVAPVVMDICKTGQAAIGPGEANIERRVEDHPAVTGEGFHDVMGAKVPIGLHLCDADGIMIGFDDACQHLGIAATGAAGVMRSTAVERKMPASGPIAAALFSLKVVARGFIR